MEIIIIIIDIDLNFSGCSACRENRIMHPANNHVFGSSELSRVFLSGSIVLILRLSP